MHAKEFAEQFIKAQTEAWENGKFDELEAIEHANVVYHIPGLLDTVGFKGHKQHIQSMAQIISDSEHQWEYFVGDGNVFQWAIKSELK